MHIQLKSISIIWKENTTKSNGVIDYTPGRYVTLNRLAI